MTLCVMTAYIGADEWMRRYFYYVYLIFTHCLLMIIDLKMLLKIYINTVQIIEIGMMTGFFMILDLIYYIQRMKSSYNFFAKYFIRLSD